MGASYRFFAQLDALFGGQQTTTQVEWQQTTQVAGSRRRRKPSQRFLQVSLARTRALPPPRLACFSVHNPNCLCEKLHCSALSRSQTLYAPAKPGFKKSRGAPKVEVRRCEEVEDFNPSPCLFTCGLP
jgi:hypothetical protein